MAPFHYEIFKIAEDDNIKIGVIVAFRASAKSTIMSLAYPIWSILGRPKKKFPLIVYSTQIRAGEALSIEEENLRKKRFYISTLGHSYKMIFGGKTPWF